METSERVLGRPPAPPASLSQRFAAFIAERHPFALERATQAFEKARAKSLRATPREPELFALLRDELRRELERRRPRFDLPEGLETTPRVGVGERLEAAERELADACDGFLRREEIVASLSDDERRELLGGMILTRAVDNRLKTLFTGGEVRYRNAAFQGKGYRSLGQEAIYAAGLRLRRGERHRGEDGRWRGDVVAPLIRDLGAALAMYGEPERLPQAVHQVLSAQMGKAGPPMNGRDFHIGDLDSGVLPPAAPLSIAALTAAGIAFAMKHEGEGRVVVSFIGEGGSSLGEWHEAINLCAARRLPAVFAIENNQTALSTPVAEQCAARVFADKAAGYGVPGLTLDGTDPEAVAAAFAWAAERAREGLGPTLLELVSMRMCGHAHHDDMLYVGRDARPGWSYPELTDGGYADREAWAYWAERDPLARYAELLEQEGLIGSEDLDNWRRAAEEMVESEARAVIEAPWPDGAEAGEGVYRAGATARRVEVLDDRAGELDLPPLPELAPGRPFEASGNTFLEAVMLGVRDALVADERVFVYGEDVGGSYGNAFLLLRPLLAEHGDRIVNSPLCEGGTLGVLVGAALMGLRPIGEIQFNDFVATGFNQLVNNAAKTHYRWGAAVPMVVRMPWGGLRHAGPYHSQNTEAWFYRTPGLKIVAPSTPEDARALFAAAVADPDPVLFYEHIALYREPRIKQVLGEEPPAPVPLGTAALRRAGSDLLMVSYGAYVHAALRVAERLATDGIEAAVLDLRSLVPLDRETLLAAARHCGKVLVVHEDTRTGGIGESLAAVIQEEIFEYLDAPVRVLGALDTPVPYAPPLEAAFLPSEAEIEHAARRLVAY